MTTNLAHKKRPPKGFCFPIRTGLRRKVYLHPTNADLYHYAGNCPVRYIDPDGKFCHTVTLDANVQKNLINRLSNIKSKVGKINEITECTSIISWFPFPGSSYLGGGSTFVSSTANLIGDMPEKFIEAYKDTEIDALKNYTNGKAFDTKCSLELRFATTEKTVGKQDDFATVWQTLLDNPNAKAKDLPDKIGTNYFVTLRWKDENGKTLGGKTLQLDNKAEFDILRNMVVKCGGKNEE